MSMTAAPVLRGRAGLQPVVDAPRRRRLAHLSEEPGQRERRPRLVRIERQPPLEIGHRGPRRAGGVVRGGADVEHPPLRRITLLHLLEQREGQRGGGGRVRLGEDEPRPRPPGRPAEQAAGPARPWRPREAEAADAEASTAACPRLRARSTSGPLPRTSRRLARPDLERRLTAQLLERALAQTDQRGQLGGGELLSPPAGDGLEPQPERLGVPALLEQRGLQRLLGREVGRLGVLRQIGPGRGEQVRHRARLGWRLPRREPGLQPLGELRLGGRLLLRAGDDLAADALEIGRIRPHPEVPERGRHGCRQPRARRAASRRGLGAPARAWPGARAAASGAASACAGPRPPCSARWGWAPTAGVASAGAGRREAPGRAPRRCAPGRRRRPRSPGRRCRPACRRTPRTAPAPEWASGVTAGVEPVCRGVAPAGAGRAGAEDAGVLVGRGAEAGTGVAGGGLF